MNVFDILAAYNAVVSHIEGSKKYDKGLCIIVVDTIKRNINIKSFENHNHAKAAEAMSSLKNTARKIKAVKWLWFLLVQLVN